MSQLSAHDRAILNSIIEPLVPECEEEEEPEQPLVGHEANGINGSGPPPYTEEAKAHNIRGIELSEEQKTEEAYEAFQAAISASPQWAAPYNNRAQLHRIQRRDDDAIADLDKAITLSGGKGGVACQAYIQKGLMYRYKQQDDQAKDCFTKAANLGSSYAKQRLVALNPMAQLCSQMMSRMMENARDGMEDD